MESIQLRIDNVIKATGKANFTDAFLNIIKRVQNTVLKVAFEII